MLLHHRLDRALQRYIKDSDMELNVETHPVQGKPRKPLFILYYTLFIVLLSHLTLWFYLPLL